MYKCQLCGKQFIGGERLDAERIWNEYQRGKQTILQLAKKYKCYNQRPVLIEELLKSKDKQKTKFLFAPELDIKQIDDV